MAILRRTCGDKSWGVQSTPYEDICKRCQPPSIQQLITYHRLRWYLGKVCRMDHDRLPIKTLFGKFGGQLPRGIPPKTWLEYVRDDLSHLSKLHETLGTYLDWLRLCRDRNEWATKISKVVMRTHLVLGLGICHHSIIIILLFYMCTYLRVFIETP
jgi:hypothetical protein